MIYLKTFVVSLPEDEADDSDETADFLAKLLADHYRYVEVRPSGAVTPVKAGNPNSRTLEEEAAELGVHFTEADRVKGKPRNGRPRK
jgi:hypothetical protein